MPLGSPNFLQEQAVVLSSAGTPEDQRWRALLAHAADVCWTAHDDGVLSWATPALQGVLGWSLEQVRGQSLLDAVHSEDRTSVAAAWERVVDRRAAQVVVECRVRRQDGGWARMRTTITDLRDEPHVGALVGNAVDVTAAHDAQQEQARDDRRFRARFERSTVAQAFVDGSGVLTDVNAAACALLGRAPSELLGVRPQAVTHPSDTGGADVLLDSLLRGTQEAGRAERVMLGPDDRPVPVLVDMVLLRDDEGRPAGAAAFLHDLTALRDAERDRQRQQDLFQALTRRASDLALVSDAAGQLLFLSPSVEHVLGYDAGEVVSRSGWDFVHPDDRGPAMSVYADVVASGGTGVFVARVRAADGSWRWIEETVTNLLDTALGGMVANLRDVTEQVEAEKALRASEARYRTIVDTAEEGIWAVGSRGCTLYANARLAGILGRPLEEVYARPAPDLFGGSPTARHRLAGLRTDGTERYELAYPHPDGGERRLWIAASPLRDADGAVEGTLAMVSDVTDERRLAQELRHAALHDALTGLPNRALLLDRLDQALARETTSTAVLFFDLDQFKLVNDSRGHAVGDLLLVAATERLRAAVRSTDTVARFGGDEFVIVCEDTDAADAGRLARGVLAAFAAPFELEGHALHISASVGIAVSPAPSAGDLLRYADTAMYSAKNEGRARVRHFDAALSEQAEERYALAAELRQALAADDLAVHYQPVVDLRSGAVVGAEALARWTSTSRGPVPPDVFVRLAELTGLAPELDRWVVRRAMRDAGALRSAGVLPAGSSLAVNLSPYSTGDPGLEELLLSSAAASGLSPCEIVLEITEGAIMQDTATSITVLRRLRAHGFAVAIDDFGTGYSSLAYLRDLPVTCLKIDRSFITAIATDRDALAIVASIVDLARAVGIEVVAEGVETAGQAALLRRLGCASAQGWLWSRAVPPAELMSARWTEPFAVDESATGPVLRRATPRPVARAEHGLERLLVLHGEGASLATIAAALNAEGYRTPVGARWHRTSVARTIADNAYPTLSQDPAAS